MNRIFSKILKIFTWMVSVIVEIIFDICNLAVREKFEEYVAVDKRISSSVKFQNVFGEKTSVYHDSFKLH